MMNGIASNAWLVPAVPLAASLAILFLAGKNRAVSSALAIIGQVVALLFSIISFVPTLRTAGYRATQNFTWFSFGEQTLRIGFVIDPLAAAMLIMITLVGLCIFVFSTGYMRGDKDFARFFAYLSFFSAAMLGVVIANSLLLLFICWELVGVASYLLIGFWIERPSAAAAANKAFITTRIGDLGLFLGLLWLYGKSGTLLFYDNGHGCIENAALVSLGANATLIALLIFFGAVGKSGQFPLHVWLPDAMEGPTPVSALIHAATMVAAGVFLVARVYPLFSGVAAGGGDPGDVARLNAVGYNTTPSLTVVVTIGVITALMASLIALAQFDIKRILAYSTVSQLGLMMVSLGVGGVAAGILHLIAHGFFKALLFLGAGSVIHGLHHEQDIRKMGGLRFAMPITFITYAIGVMNLSGVPLFFAGGWTKEGILHATAHWHVSQLPYYLMLLGVVLTALYMTRQFIYVFLGSRHIASVQAHESPKVMTRPLIVLATSSILLVAILTSAWPWFHSYLNGERPTFHLALLFQPMILLSLALVAAGFGLGWFIYRDVDQDDPFAQAQPAVFRFFENKLWLDELYNHTVIALAKLAAQIADWMDRNIWDGLVRLTGGLGGLFGALTKSFDESAINSGADRLSQEARAIGRVLSKGHSGQIQTYLGAIALGMLALLLIYAWLI
jgi:NADH-quinone oxidoreductase subunit L